MKRTYKSNPVISKTEFYRMHRLHNKLVTKEWQVDEHLFNHWFQKQNPQKGYIEISENETVSGKLEVLEW